MYLPYAGVLCDKFGLKSTEQIMHFQSMLWSNLTADRYWSWLIPVPQVLWHQLPQLSHSKADKKTGHRWYVCEVTGIRRYSTFDQKKNSERIFLDKQYLKDISYGAVIYLIFRMRKENAINSHKYSNFWCRRTGTFVKFRDVMGWLMGAVAWFFFISNKSRV